MELQDPKHERCVVDCVCLANHDHAVMRLPIPDGESAETTVDRDEHFSRGVCGGQHIRITWIFRPGANPFDVLSRIPQTPDCRGRHAAVDQ